LRNIKAYVLIAALEVKRVSKINQRGPAISPAGYLQFGLLPGFIIIEL
jgi:hypothetical protein